MEYSLLCSDWRGTEREASQSLTPPTHIFHTQISSVELVSVLPMNWCRFYGMLCYKDWSSPSGTRISYLQLTPEFLFDKTPILPL